MYLDMPQSCFWNSKRLNRKYALSSTTWFLFSAVGLTWLTVLAIAERVNNPGKSKFTLAFATTATSPMLDKWAAKKWDATNTASDMSAVIVPASSSSFRSTSTYDAGLELVPDCHGRKRQTENTRVRLV